MACANYAAQLGAPSVAAPTQRLRPSATPGVCSQRRQGLSVVCMAKKKEESIYSKTVNLPDTKFDMRANSTVKEPAMQKFWADNKIYEQLYEENPGETFTLHDGPPYANGDLHIGHALNKILKDFINRYQMLQGRKVRYVPGWDCHGLPIELKVLQGMKSEERQALTPIKLRQKAAKFAKKTVDSQRSQFMRYGIWADWEDPYMTLLPQYEAAQIGVFGKMFLNGHIYRGKKPVHWSPSSRTALAEAELEYPEGHTSRSIYVAMPMESLSADLPEEVQSKAAEAALAIWTTTPWTIPANAAVAVNDRLTYVLAEMAEPKEGGRKYVVVAKDLMGALSEKVGCDLTVVAEFTGAQLEGSTYTHPLMERSSPVVVGGDYITTESGTGLVHTAPGHGQEDYQTGLKYDLPLYSPVDDAGNFTADAGKDFEGKSVLGDGNVAVIEALQASGALLLEEAYGHKYPYDWRTKKPTIFRATAQWFASVEGFRDEALGAIKGVSWLPAVGENRITAMTEGRADWCISRQRTWGVPIPVFYDTTSGEPLMNADTIEHVQNIVAEKGTDAWFYMEIEDLLPEQYKELAPTLRKGTDTMDVWFDSGSSWASVVEARGMALPADLYLEGSDQHRGWFQSSLLTSVAATGVAPYKQVLTHGFVLDEKGYKMSKSLGNVIDPRLVIDGGKNLKAEPAYGADVLRLWVSSVDYSNDVLIGPSIIKQTFDVYRKVRGTVRYILGNLSDYDPSKDAVAYADLPLLDRYALYKLGKLVAECETAYSSYQFYRVFQALSNFNATFLSTFFLDTAKDRLYIRGQQDPARRACQTTLDSILQVFLAVVAPILPHMAEDAYQNSHLKAAEGVDSVFKAGWTVAAEEWGTLPEAELQLMDTVLAVRDTANKALDSARAAKLVGAGLDAKVVVWVEDAALRERLTLMTEETDAAVDELRYLLIVSQVEVTGNREDVEARCGEYVEVDEEASVVVGVLKADGAKCERCWNFAAVGGCKEHPGLCSRCAPVVISLPNPPTPVPVEA